MTPTLALTLGIGIAIAIALALAIAIALAIEIAIVPAIALVQQVASATRSHAVGGICNPDPSRSSSGGTPHVMTPTLALALVIAIGIAIALALAIAIVELVRAGVPRSRAADDSNPRLAAGQPRRCATRIPSREPRPSHSQSGS
jgi:hypothetical protein